MMISPHSSPAIIEIWGYPKPPISLVIPSSTPDNLPKLVQSYTKESISKWIAQLEQNLESTQVEVKGGQGSLKGKWRSTSRPTWRAFGKQKGGTAQPVHCVQGEGWGTANSTQTIGQTSPESQLDHKWFNSRNRGKGSAVRMRERPGRGSGQIHLTIAPPYLPEEFKSTKIWLVANISYLLAQWLFLNIRPNSRLLIY